MWAPAQGRLTMCFVRALAGVLPKSHRLPESTWPNGLHPEELRPGHCALLFCSLLRVWTLATHSDHSHGDTAQQCPLELEEVWVVIKYCQVGRLHWEGVAGPAKLVLYLVPSTTEGLLLLSVSEEFMEVSEVCLFCASLDSVSSV